MTICAFHHSFYFLRTKYAFYWDRILFVWLRHKKHYLLQKIKKNLYRKKSPELIFENANFESILSEWGQNKNLEIVFIFHQRKTAQPIHLAVYLCIYIFISHRSDKWGLSLIDWLIWFYFCEITFILLTTRSMQRLVKRKKLYWLYYYYHHHQLKISNRMKFNWLSIWVCIKLSAWHMIRFWFSHAQTIHGILSRNGLD